VNNIILFVLIIVPVLVGMMVYAELTTYMMESKYRAYIKKLNRKIRNSGYHVVPDAPSKLGVLAALGLALMFGYVYGAALLALGY
jgi:divalent metal cation (Fe/Co/Zn/Cd) transporter